MYWRTGGNCKKVCRCLPLRFGVCVLEGLVYASQRLCAGKWCNETSIVFYLWVRRRRRREGGRGVLRIERGLNSEGERSPFADLSVREKERREIR